MSHYGMAARILGFVDSPEYLARKATPFKVPNYSISQIRAAVPDHLHKPSVMKSTMHWVLTVSFVTTFFALGAQIDTMVAHTKPLLPSAEQVLRLVLNLIYWWWQGLALAGFITYGHECAHGAMFVSPWANGVMGFPLMNFVFMPYFGWQASHGSHHKTANSVERDENFVPRTRTELGYPEKPAAVSHAEDDEEPEDDTEGDHHGESAFADAPIVLLIRMLLMQFFGMQYYLTTNAMGNLRHPAWWTNHFNPDSSLFRPSIRHKIILSDIGLLLNAAILFMVFRPLGLAAFVKLYFVPYLIANHWIVILTYLNHTCPTVPHYREGVWTFARGALATVDRPLLGWMGRVFLHNVAHDHVAHHLFSRTPFYNQPQVTLALKNLLGSDYMYDSTPVYRAVYRAFTQCYFVEDDDEVVFYKDQKGRQGRQLARESVPDITKA